MGDHFVLLVDWLLTESTIEAAIESRNRSQQATPSAKEVSRVEFSNDRMENGTSSSPSKLVQCRICHDEDEDSNMEIPCSCCGSLKYAHRKCVQRWCDQKGDTICEICREHYKPGYTLPPPLFCYGGNFTENSEISRRVLHNPQLINMLAADREFQNFQYPEYLDSEFDEYYAPSPSSLLCFRIVAIIFMVLLVLRHTLPIFIGDYSLTTFTLLMLRTIGILLPIYAMVKAFKTIIQRYRHQQDSHLALAASNEENELPQQQHTRPRIIIVR